PSMPATPVSRQASKTSCVGPSPSASGVHSSRTPPSPNTAPTPAFAGAGLYGAFGVKGLTAFQMLPQGSGGAACPGSAQEGPAQRPPRVWRRGAREVPVDPPGQAPGDVCAGALGAIPGASARRCAASRGPGAGRTLG